MHDLDAADLTPQHDTLVFVDLNALPLQDPFVSQAEIRFVNCSIDVQSVPAQSVTVAAGVLAIGGGLQGDEIHIQQTSPTEATVSAGFLPGGQTTVSLDGVNIIVADLGAGDDSLIVAPGVTVPVEINGGDGSDMIVAGGGPALLLGGDGDDLLIGGFATSILVGGAGDDTLIGRQGRNILIGGDGRDSLHAGHAGDILIGGSTIYDANDAALQTIMNEWNSAASYTTRVADLRTGLGPVLGGTGIRLEKGVTVLDEDDVDLLHGGAGGDWFLFDTALDVLQNRKPNEAGN